MNSPRMAMSPRLSQLRKYHISDRLQTKVSWFAQTLEWTHEPMNALFANIRAVSLRRRQRYVPLKETSVCLRKTQTDRQTDSSSSESCLNCRCHRVLFLPPSSLFDLGTEEGTHCALCRRWHCHPLLPCIFMAHLSNGAARQPGEILLPVCPTKKSCFLHWVRKLSRRVSSILPPLTIKCSSCSSIHLVSEFTRRVGCMAAWLW